MNFAFLLDADARIGIGHLMRCITIANEIEKRGFHCHFLCRALTSSLQRLILDQGHKSYIVRNKKSIHALLAQLNPECIVIDNYKLDEKFERTVRCFSKQILVIDDLANRSHFCDVLLDQGPLRTTDDYRPIINLDCQLLLGVNYALIRPEFRNLRKSDTSSWKKGLISFGGADPNNITLKILQALDLGLRMKDAEWTVVAGTASPHLQSLEEFISKSQLNITLLEQSNEIATLLATSDFAIGAAGGMAWERSCIGIPTLTLPIADNQKYGIEVIKHFRLGETLEIADLTPTVLLKALKRLRKNSSVYLRRNQAMVDGLGVMRLMKYILPSDQ